MLSQPCGKVISPHLQVLNGSRRLLTAKNDLRASWNKEAGCNLENCLQSAEECWRVQFWRPCL